MINKIKSLFFRIFNQNHNFEEHTYQSNFLKAIKRTKRLGLEVPVIEFSKNEKPYLTEEYQELLFKDLADMVFHTNEINAQCMSFNYRLKEYFENLTNDNFIYTIGYIKYNEKVMFEQTEESLKKMIHKGIQSKDGSINIHVWLTLPSMEILDLTLPTTLGKVWNEPELIGRPLAKHADEFDGIEYIPLLVGDDFLKQSGAMKYIINFI